MSKEVTTLSLSRELAQEIRGFEGRNTDEKLRNWADSFSSEEEDFLSEEECRRIAREEAENKIYELKREF